MAVPGLTPRSPLSVVGPVLVTVWPPITEKAPTVPSPTVASAAYARGGVANSPKIRRALIATARRDAQRTTGGPRQTPGALRRRERLGRGSVILFLSGRMPVSAVETIRVRVSTGNPLFSSVHGGAFALGELENRSAECDQLKSLPGRLCGPCSLQKIAHTPSTAPRPLARSSKSGPTDQVVRSRPLVGSAGIGSHIQRIHAIRTRGLYLRRT